MIAAGQIPFDAERLDELLEQAGADVLLATSGHAVRYLLGGYRFFLYAVLDGIGMDRYLPVVGYVRGAPERAFYVGAGNEAWGVDVSPPWVPSLELSAWTGAQAAEIAARRLQREGFGRATIAIEPPHVPSDAIDRLRAELPAARLMDGGQLLEDLRAVKQPHELELLRAGATAVVDAMLATFAGAAAGITTGELAERLRVEQTERGLTYGYCLVAAGDSINRAPSGRLVEEGAVVSLDSGAHMRGYVADLTRMAVAGEPAPRARELLDQIVEVQAAARAAVAGGRRGGGVFDAADAVIAELPDGAAMTFLAHGTGLLSHEAPRLTATGSPPYPATHREQPLQAGMVLSIETHAIDDAVGFVKLEDTVIVTADGCEACGDHGRDWNRLGG
ncbi:MAG TPA: Xaa-Pro peptidase family protein [Conexibacter sp.]